MQGINAVNSSRHSNTFKRAGAILRSLGTPFSDKLVRAMSDGDYRKITKAELCVGDYPDADSFARDYLAYSLLRKFDSFPLGIDTEAVALEKFFESEAACSIINRTNVMPYAAHSCGTTPETYISYARKRIRNLLGVFDWNQAWERCAFSGGASTRLKRKVGAPFYKYQGKPETTRSNARLAVCAIQSIPLWKEQMVSAYGDNPSNWVTIVEGSRVTTVAKTAETDRCIAIEPDMNMFMQRGIGSVIRQKLKSVKVDLNDQSNNQKLAKIGSETGSLVTIDLASASDSIALELVRLLLPHDWFEALCLCRSEYGILPNGHKHRFEKISSMGNGYTFELESLIFWALSQAVLEVEEVSDRRLGIYGDDIVIHNSCAEVLIEVLSYCGFTTNKEKTFLSGPFRESCGKHYFYGKDVTPFYIKTPLETINRWYWVANSLRKWTADRSDPERYQKCYDYLVKLVPHRLRHTVPVSLGAEAGFWASFDECCPSYSKWKQAYSTKVLRSRRKKHDINGSPALLHYFNGVVGSPPELLPDNFSYLEKGSSSCQIEKGETRYYHSKVYLSWWDTAPCGVIFRDGATGPKGRVDATGPKGRVGVP